MHQQILDDEQTAQYVFPPVPATVKLPEIVASEVDDESSWLGQDVASTSDSGPANPLAEAARNSANNTSSAVPAAENSNVSNGSQANGGSGTTPNLQPQQPAVVTPQGVNGPTPSLNQGGGGQVDQLLSAPELQKFPDPPEGFPDFALTVLNAIGKFSIEEKVPILAEKMTEESVGWFCYMFVKHRASKETNLHRAYLTFLEQIDMTKRSLRVMDNITNTTYDCLNVLLKSVGQALHSTSHRTVLKNLGAWLGACTLGRNKTLKARSLDLKQLLLQATENGHLTAILPMVCNVMEGVAAS